VWDSSKEFIQKEIPKLHPLSGEYQDYWQDQIRTLIEGKWINGVWIPPQLYHYYNFGTIFIGKGKNRYKSRPYNLDYIWDFYYYWIEARGLSGFEKVGDVQDIRSFLRTRQSITDLGKPLYNNQAKNMLCLASRGFGKSFMAADIAAHTYTTDGRTEYNPGLPNRSKAEILLSAYASPYVNDLIEKIQDVLNNYPGGIEVNGIYHPAPLYRTISGTWTVGKRAEHYYKKKIGGKWKQVGTRSCFKPRIYKDNPGAGLGGRNILKIGEEVGTWNNIIESHFADENTQKLNNDKFGSSLYIGTGGDATNQAIQKMMYDPEAYDCISIDDKWESRGRIAIFFPCTYTKLNYKDSNGITITEFAESSEQIEREKKKASKSNDAYNEYVIYNPLLPSEIFLSKGTNKFPLKDLQYTLAKIEMDQRIRDAEYIGDLIVNEASEVAFQVNTANNPIYDFPLKNSADTNGSIILYEMPQLSEDDKAVQWGRYIAGIDPYDHDHSETNSLGSCIVLDRLTNRIVAEYTARPETAKDYYENCRRLLTFYNAKALYENEKKGIFDYFESKQALHLLAVQPRLIKDIIENSKTNRGFGMHMPDELKRYGEGLINQWLRDTNNAEQKNVHKIRCIPLLKELILYNPDGNFDRVMALMLALYQLNEMRTYPVEDTVNYVPMHHREFFTRKKFNHSIITQLR
jgi:hypothetical protein